MIDNDAQHAAAQADLATVNEAIRATEVVAGRYKDRAVPASVSAAMTHLNRALADLNDAREELREGIGEYEGRDPEAADRIDRERVEARRATSRGA